MHVIRRVILIMVALLSILATEGKRLNTIVVDSVTRLPLASASVFDRNGNAVGIGSSKGRLPYVPPDRYPITVRYLGYGEKQVPNAFQDTVFLSENTFELPEVMVETRRRKVLHILAYVREYSTLTTYSDTIFLFREKMVDYMLPSVSGSGFKGWTKPRIIKTRSYYRFTDSHGLDSVSSECNHHFSWSDWVGLAPATSLPEALRQVNIGVDTVRGKYSPTEIWTKNGDRVSADINVLADTASRKWVPNLSIFFREKLDFENFRIRFNYDNILTDRLSPAEITGYSYNIESNGRGRNMFRFNRFDEPFFVSTYGEVYVLDKEYITEKEAKKWDKSRFDSEDIEIYEPMEAPALQPSILALVERVDKIDKDKVRLDQTPDQRLVTVNSGKKNFSVGNRALSLLKQVTGITLVRSRKNFNRRWDDFRKQRRERNSSQVPDS